MSIRGFRPQLLLVILLWQLSYGDIIAQSDWQEGYVVTNSGDTLRGMVRDRNTDAFGGRFDKILLRRGGIRAKRFQARKIKAYSWGDIRFVVLRTESFSKLFKTRTHIVEKGGTPGFYRVIADGPLRLYWVEFTDNDTFDIVCIPYFNKAGDDQLVRATQGIFGLKKKLLSKYFSDRPDLVQKIQNGDLNTPEEVVEAY